jgi:hypothetical protein
METIKIPKRFYDDHCDRELDAPAVVRETKAHYFIDANSEHLAELLDDAEYYGGDAAPDWAEGFGVRTSAAATVRAIKAAA